MEFQCADIPTPFQLVPFEVYELMYVWVNNSVKGNASSDIIVSAEYSLMTAMPSPEWGEAKKLAPRLFEVVAESKDKNHQGKPVLRYTRECIVSQDSE